jgi:opacity protein-like surface antigen
MRRAVMAAFAAVCLFTLPTVAQTVAKPPAPPENQGSFSLNAQAVALPGGGQTVAATDVGATFAITTNFSLRDDNILAPSNGMQFYGGGGNYFLPTSFLAKTKLSPSSFQPYVTASLGVDRIVPASGPSQQHIAFLIGGGLNYKPTSGVWVNLFEARYAKLPGLAVNTAIVSSGFTLNF